MKLIYLLIMVLIPIFLSGKELARFSVLNNQADKLDAIVSVSLSGCSYNSDNGFLFLYEITETGKKVVACQIDNSYSSKLWFIIEGVFRKNEEREYIIEIKNQPSAENRRIKIETSEKFTTIFNIDKPILSYQHTTAFPPEGVDSAYQRSAFIHPLYSPGGEVLTRIQPPDHYHHYGIWNPWTKTTFNGQHVDFWNLVKKEGTVKFVGYLDKEEGNVYSGFKVHQEHLFFKEKRDPGIALDEIWDVRVWNTSNNIFIIDLSTTLNTPLSDGILLDAYRYGGGIGFRATEKWHKDNCTVLTSESKTRIDADGSNARWCIVEGESGTKEGRSGILFLSHPSNRKHPEPMRIWPLDANNGRGDLFFEFCPIRNEEWKLEPKQNYTLKYRMIVFDGNIDKETAQMYWDSFVIQPIVTFKLNKND